MNMCVHERMYACMKGCMNESIYTANSGPIMLLVVQTYTASTRVSTHANQSLLLLVLRLPRHSKTCFAALTYVYFHAFVVPTQ